jgi:hypothetical protein
MIIRMTRLPASVLSITLLLWCLSLGEAAEKPKVDPTGTWKLITLNSETNAKLAERTLKLKLGHGKLSGTISGRSSVNGKVTVFEWPIKDARLEGDAIAFTVTHAPTLGTGSDSTTVYEGKITADVIKGTSQMEWSGHNLKREFEARRVKE